MGTTETTNAPETTPDTKQEKKYGSCELVMTYETRRDLDLLKAKIGEIHAQLTEDYKLLEERKSFYPDSPRDVEYIDRSIICTAACLAKYACRLFADGHMVMQPDWLTWFARNTEHATVRLRRVYEIMERLIYNTDNNFDPVGLALIKLYCDPGTEVLPSTYRDTIAIHLPKCGMKFIYTTGRVRAAELAAKDEVPNYSLRIQSMVKTFQN